MFAKKLLCLMALSIVAPLVAVAGDAAKEIFVAQKCVKCHSIDAQGVETTSKKDPSEISDLSEVGSKHDQAAISAYLKRESEMNGKKHKYKFKGTDEEFETVVAWLASLKAE